MLKKITLLIIALLLMLSFPALALAADIELNLSTSCATVESNITASGIASPETWVIIKVVDKEGNIIFFETTRTDNHGNYNLTFKTPLVPVETIFTAIVGYGDQTITKEFIVEPRRYRNPNRDIELSKGKEKENKEEEKLEEEKKKEEEPAPVNITLTIGQTSARINNTTHQFDAMPFIEADTSRTVVPLRFIGESLNAEVQWIASTRQIVIRDTGNVIILWIDSYDSVVNGQRIHMDCPPRILMNDRTFVPLRFINEVLGANVDWDEETKEINIIR